MMILDRYWADDWDYTPSLLDRAASRLESLYHAAGRTGLQQPGASAEIRRLLSSDLKRGRRRAGPDDFHGPRLQLTGSAAVRPGSLRCSLPGSLRSVAVREARRAYATP
jgi:hypothetical protein